MKRNVTDCGRARERERESEGGRDGRTVGMDGDKRWTQIKRPTELKKDFHLYQGAFNRVLGIDQNITHFKMRKIYIFKYIYLNHCSSTYLECIIRDNQ